MTKEPRKDLSKSYFGKSGSRQGFLYVTVLAVLELAL